MLTRFRTTLTADGRTDTRYADAEDHSKAAWATVRAWRSDAMFRHAYVREGYTEYAFRGPRSFTDYATVRVYKD